MKKQPAKMKLPKRAKRRPASRPATRATKTPARRKKPVIEDDLHERVITRPSKRGMVAPVWPKKR